MRSGRLSGEVPASGETFHPLAVVGTARVEHIVSSGSPDTSGQRQDWDEWVLVVAGAADLEVEGTPVRLDAGDWLLLPAGTAHRVLGTQAGTHWLAVHAGGPAS